MKKTVRLMAAMAVLLTASGCSQDDLMPDGGKGKGTGAVGVTTFVANGARGVALNNTDDLIASENGFDLFAYESDETQFMGTETDGIEFAYNGGWDYVNAGEVKFWRQVTDGNTVNFYAVSPANTATPTIGYDAQTINYTVADNSADQKDLMYAKTLGVDPKNQTVIDNGVHLDFYHALSQIVFKARTTDEYITANVEEVEIVNLHNAGTFTFANAAYEDYTAEVTPWEITGAAPEAAYLAEIPDAKVTGIKAEATDLTTSATALLLLPQEVKGAVTPDKTQAPEDGGTYVRVKCHVTYKGENDDAATDIYGTEGEYANLYIPLNSEWKAGYKYIYTIVFSKDISDPVTINEDLYVGPWYEDDANNSDIIPKDDELEYVSTDEFTGFRINSAKSMAEMRDLINSGAQYIVRDGKAITVASTATEGDVYYYSQSNYQLTRDIDLTSVLENGRWEPIGPSSTSVLENSEPLDRMFNSATFDGCGNTISGLAIASNPNLTLESGHGELLGLFSFVYMGTVKNLTVESAESGYSNMCCLGGIVAMGILAEFEDCHYTGNISSDVDDSNIVGGVVGAAMGSDIIACSYSGTIDVYGIAGGITAGIMGYGSSVTNLVGMDDFLQPATAAFSRASVGVAKLYGSYSSGAITVKGASGNGCSGIVVDAQGASIMGCYTTMIASASIASAENIVGCIVAMDNDCKITGNAYAYYEGAINNYDGNVAAAQTATDGVVSWSDANDGNNALILLNNALIEAGCAYSYEQNTGDDATNLPLIIMPTE